MYIFYHVQIHIAVILCMLKSCLLRTTCSSAGLSDMHLSLYHLLYQNYLPSQTCTAIHVMCILFNTLKVSGELLEYALS